VRFDVIERRIAGHVLTMRKPCVKKKESIVEERQSR